MPYTPDFDAHMNELLADPQVRKLYDDLEPEYMLLAEMLKARKAAGMTQSDVAQKMGTKRSAITRLEGALANGARSPSLATLKKYAGSLGCKLCITFVPVAKEA